MGTPIGNLGGIAVFPESTYGVTPGTPAWVWQHPMPSTIGLRREVVEPNLLSFKPATRGYSGKFVDGDMVVGLTTKVGVIGDILGLAGNDDDTALTYVLAGGAVPEVNSLSTLISYGGGGADPTNNHEWVHTGVKPNAIRIDLLAETNSTLTLVGIGKDSVKTAAGSASDPTPPDEADVFMPTDLGALVHIGDAVVGPDVDVCLYSGTMEVLVPKTGFERRCMGGAMKEPITSGRPDVTWTLNCDLDDDTSNDTIAVLASFVAGDSLGDIQVGTSFKLTDCLMGGDFPPLQDGQIDFTISGTASSLEFVTVV